MDRTSRTRTLGLEAETFEIRRAQDIGPAFDALKHRVEGLYLASEALQDANRLRINILALGARLPTMWAQQELAEAGGLMSYGPNFPDLWRRAGDFVDKIRDQIRFGYQSNCSERAGPRNSADGTRPRRRGDRVNCPPAFGRPWSMKPRPLIL
jgi:hypothetical protein